MAETIRIETTQQYELNKLYANIGDYTGVFACVEIERRPADYLTTFEVVWRQQNNYPSATA
ncbi:TPA_asm: hypothetical protein GHJ26_09400 [Listeria monocytogenes]|nr:hypothetical protein [Listeria monocytogenes]HAA7190419.1 hypothetical protein [Listeria monocytogenes]